MLKSLQRKLITDMAWTGTFVLRRHFCSLVSSRFSFGDFFQTKMKYRHFKLLAQAKKLIFKPEKTLLLFLWLPFAGLLLHH